MRKLSKETAEQFAKRLEKISPELKVEVKGEDPIVVVATAKQLTVTNDRLPGFISDVFSKGYQVNLGRSGANFRMTVQ